MMAGCMKRGLQLGSMLLHCASSNTCRILS